MPDTTNLVVSPNLKGDISSCTTNITYLNGSARYGFWTEENTGYATNNCTGKVDTFHSWSFTGIADCIFALVFVIIGLAILRFIFD